MLRLQKLSNLVNFKKVLFPRILLRARLYLASNDISLPENGKINVTIIFSKTNIAIFTLLESVKKGIRNVFHR